MQLENLNEKNKDLEAKLVINDQDKEKLIGDLEKKLSTEQSNLSELMQKNQNLDSQKLTIQKNVEI